MAITQQQADIVAGSLVTAYRSAQRKPGDYADPRVCEALRQATMDAMHGVAVAAPDETLIDVRSSYSYKAALRVSVTVTLLVATDQRLWVARHAEGQAQAPTPVPFQAIRPVGKRVAMSLKIEPGPDGVTIITSGRGTAEWLESLRAGLTTGPAAWLTSAAPTAATVPAESGQSLPPPGWHPDPTGRHQVRWWDGASWSDQVGDQGVQGTDPLA